MAIWCFDKFSHALNDEMPGQGRGIISQLREGYFSLTIVNFANVLKPIDDQLLYIGKVEFWTTLERQYSIINSPDFVLSPS